MSYTLELIFVYKSDSMKKFNDIITSDDRERYIEFENNIVLKFIESDSFVDKPVLSRTDYVNDNNDIVMIRRIGKFKRLDDAEKFYVKRQTDPDPIRVKFSDIAMSCNVFGEFNILDDDENVLNVLASCQQGICNRRADKRCTVHTDNPGCYDPNEFDPRTVSGPTVHHVSISSIKRINSNNGAGRENQTFGG
jgi:hypothetical protein